MAEITGFLSIIKSATSGESVRDAIIKCMETINADGALKTKSLIITKPDNTSYHPGTGYAYNVVTVNIDGSGDDDPETKFVEFSVNNFTENGEHTPQTEGYDEHTYFNKVNVDIDPLGDPDYIADVLTADSVGKDDGGTFFDASFKGYTAVKKIYFDNSYNLPVNPDPEDPDPSKKYLISFYDWNGLLLAQYKLPYGENPYNYLDITPTREGKEFRGWKPTVTDVKGSANYTAVYGDPSIDPPGELSWEDICGGASVPMGYIKDLYVEDTYHFAQWFRKTNYMGHDISAVTIKECDIGSIGAGSNMRFMKVYEGESGTMSTWLSTTPLNVPAFSYGAGYGMDSIAFGHGNCGDYRYNTICEFLNTYLIQVFPQCLKDHIQTVNKYQFGIANPAMSQEDLRNNPNSVSGTSKLQKIWLPSMGEISPLFGNIDYLDQEKIFTSSGWDITIDNTFLEFEKNAYRYNAWAPEPEYIWNPSQTQSDQNWFPVMTRSTVTSVQYAGTYRSIRGVRFRTSGKENNKWIVHYATDYQFGDLSEDHFNGKVYSIGLSDETYARDPKTKGLFIGFCIG